MRKLLALKTVLWLGAIYYIIGGVAHYFALTIFPWFDGRLYAPYQDTVLAFVAVVLAGLLITVARDPVKNIDVLYFIMLSALAASVFSVAIIFKVDFAALGAPAKKAQTVTEGLVGVLFVAALWRLRPKLNKNR